MSTVANAQELLRAIKQRNLDGATVAIEAGADVNGHPGQPYPPIAGASMVKCIDIIEHLLEQGADPDKPIATELSCPDPACTESHTYMVGERSLHAAAKNGMVEIARLLLNKGHADPNVTDRRGYTPLMATCESSSVCVEVVRLLLEAGADGALAQTTGYTPLHAVAHHGHIDVVDMLYTAAPATLNRCSANDESPLFRACAGGHESVVSKLLSLGAVQRIPLDAPNVLPLTSAVTNGLDGVVRVLINEGGIRAVGGEMALAQALYVSVHFRQARILRQLVEVDGEEGRSEWANTYLQSMHVLHYGVGFCYPAAVSVLLAAGADETARDSEMRTPRELIGRHLEGSARVKRRQEKEVAIGRMLDRGPAYRARSWAWPVDEEAGAGGSGDGDAAAAAAAAVAVLSSASAAKTPYVVGVRIFRPEEKSSSKFFVRLIERYCAKDQLVPGTCL